MKHLKIARTPILRPNPVSDPLYRAFFLIILVYLPAVCFSQNKSRGPSLKIVQLSPPRLTGPVSLEQTLAERRSVREFAVKALDFEQIGQLAWAGQGITEEQRGFRTAPSAGALYPMQLYFAIKDGLFLYNPHHHRLESTLDRDIREKLYRAALDQQPVADAPCDIIIAGEVKKLAAKYGKKARRFMLLEAGHIAQNIQLQAVSLGLGTVTIGAFDVKDVGRVCRLTAALEPLYIIPVGYPVGRDTAQIQPEQQTQQEYTNKTKKAVLIIASQKFRDEELFETQKAIAAAQVETVIASTKTGVIKGMLGGKAEADILVNDIVVNDYDAIIFIGGTGAKEYFESRVALDIARRAVEKGKILAAICIAPAILANAGVLDGVRATSFSTERIRLKKAGAQFTDADVERDGLIITAKSPTAAAQFAKTVAKALRER